MKIVEQPKKILFDGEQEDFFKGESTLHCCKCGSKITIDHSRMQLIAGDNVELIEVLQTLKGLTEIKIGTNRLFKIDNLPLKFVETRCDSCDSGYLLVFGVGEYQPMRFMVVHSATLSI
jgi:hypothetical protein